MTILMIQHGWRTASIIISLVTWVIGLPLTWFFVRPRRPEYYGLLPDGEIVEEMTDTEAMIKAGQEYIARETGEVEFTLRQAMRTRFFWIEAASTSLQALAWPCVTLHLIPHLIDMGVDPVAAASALGLMVLMSTPARLLGGALADRVPIRRLKYLWMLSPFLRGISLLVLMYARSLQVIYLFDAFYGLGLGILVGAQGPIRARYYGRKAYSTIEGTSSLITLPVRVVGPIYVGWVYDVTGSYMVAYQQTLAMLGVATLILLFADPPKKKPEVVSNVKKFL
jgi:cyanate permease